MAPVVRPVELPARLAVDPAAARDADFAAVGVDDAGEDVTDFAGVGVDDAGADVADFVDVEVAGAGVLALGKTFSGTGPVTGRALVIFFS